MSTEQDFFYISEINIQVLWCWLAPTKRKCWYFYMKILTKYFIVQMCILWITWEKQLTRVVLGSFYLCGVEELLLKELATWSRELFCSTRAIAAGILFLSAPQPPIIKICIFYHESYRCSCIYLTLWACSNSSLASWTLTSNSFIFPLSLSSNDLWESSLVFIWSDI